MVTGHGVKPDGRGPRHRAVRGEVLLGPRDARTAGHASSRRTGSRRPSTPGDDAAVGVTCSRRHSRHEPDSTRGPPCPTPSCCRSTTKRHGRCRARRGPRLLRRRGHRRRRRVDRRDAARARRRATTSRVVHLDRNCGYGCALKIGFRIAHDLGRHAAHHDGLRRPARAGAHPAVPRGAGRGRRHRLGQPLPARKRDGGRGARSRGRRSTERITAEINSVTGWGLTDAFCGFKAYRLPALDCIRLDEPGYAMPLELWAKAWKCGLDGARDAGRAHLLRPRPHRSARSSTIPRRATRTTCDVWNRALEEDS